MAKKKKAPAKESGDKCARKQPDLFGDLPPVAPQQHRAPEPKWREPYSLRGRSFELRVGTVEQPFEKRAAFIVNPAGATWLFELLNFDGQHLILAAPGQGGIVWDCKNSKWKGDAKERPGLWRPEPALLAAYEEYRRAFRKRR